MSTLICSAIVFAVSLGASAVADSTAPSVRLEEVLRRVWRSSPQLEGQTSLTSLASGDGFRRFIPNEPQFQYSNSDDHTADSFGLTLSTSFPGKTLALTRLDGAKARGQEAELRAKKYDLARLVTQAFLDCASAQAGHELQKTTSGDQETIFNTLKSLYETGHSTQAEKIGAELQARQAKYDLLAAQDREEVACKKFDSILASASSPGLGGVAPPSPHGAHEILELPEDLAPPLISELGPATSDQNRALAAIDTADAASFTAVWSQLPDLSLFVNRNHYVYLAGSPSGQAWTTTFGVQATFPLLFPFHESVEAARARSQAEIDRNAAELQRVAADSDRIDGAREYRRSRSRLRELKSKDLALAEALMESTMAAYRAGKLGYSELVLARKTLTDLKSQEIQLRASTVNSHLRCLDRCDEMSNPL